MYLIDVPSVSDQLFSILHIKMEQKYAIYHSSIWRIALSNPFTGPEL
jgi:hypothetical protein